MSLVLADVQPTENPKITEITVLEEFEGMTNGDVVKAVFPDCIDYHGIVEVKTHLDMGKTFRRSWWDSPYKGQDGLI